MSQVILDGEWVDASQVDATKHSFVGTFRPATQPDTKGADVYLCPCGASLWTWDAISDHWQRGCFDVKQYASIKRF